MVAAHQLNDPFLYGGRKGKLLQKRPKQGPALPLLQIARGRAILFPAEWAGNIMDNGRNLQDVLLYEALLCDGTRGSFRKWNTSWTLP